MRHNLNIPEEHERVLRETLSAWISQSNYSDIKDDAIGMVNLMSAHEFIYQLLIEYLAHHGQPFTHRLEWPNFTLELAMSIWFSEDSAPHDLYVLPSDNRFDFTSPELATNGWLQSHGEDPQSADYLPCDQAQRPEQLRFIVSRVNPGVSYCFVPLLQKSDDGLYTIALNDISKGLRKVLDSCVWQNRKESPAFRSVLVIPFGFEIFGSQMDQVVMTVWHEFRTAGRRKSADGRDAVKDLTIKLGFGSPQVLASFLKVMADEGEDLRERIESLTSTSLDMEGVRLPDNISKPWRDNYALEYRNAFLDTESWNRLMPEVLRLAEDLSGRYHSKGGFKGQTMREYMLLEIPRDRFLRMLVARRFILRYYDLVKKSGGYDRLIRELGFVLRWESDRDNDSAHGLPAIQKDNFKDYISDLGLKKRIIIEPLVTDGLFPEELEWMRNLYRPIR